MARHGRDEAGNIWELDAQGNPVRMIQPAQAPASVPGALAIPPDPTRLAAAHAEQARLAASEARAERSDQRAAAAEARAQKKFESEDTMAPPPGDTTKTGEEYLATLPNALAGQVRALIEGRRAFPTGSALRSPAVQQLIAAATQADPTLDATNSFTRVATRKDFTSGRSAQNITAINTALGHLGTLWQAAQGLKNRSLPAWNALANAAESATGDPRVGKFNLARQAVVDELERVFRGASGTETGIQGWKQAINSSQSPDQLRAAIGQGVALLNSRLEALGQQYNQGLNRSDEPIKLLNPHAQAVFSALQEGGSGVLPEDNTPPPVIGAGPPPRGPPGALGPPKADYSGMVGGPDQTLATGKYRTSFDPITSAGLNALIHKGAPYETAIAYLHSQDPAYSAPDPATYSQAVRYAADHPNWSAARANKSVPTTQMQQAMSSPVAAGIAAGLGAGTAGLDDVVGRNILGPEWDANRQALAATDRKSDLVGNVVGGVLGMYGGAKLLPGALALGGRVFGRAAPLAGDAAYGTTYGASESPDDPLTGGVLGGLAGAAGGMAGRGTVKGLANVIAPPAGKFGPAYAQGVFPTLGQRFGQSGFAGRTINTAEQAMQSMPGLGSLVTRARDIPRDAAQLGAFNESLKELAPFDPVLGQQVSRLPAGMQPGTEPHAFTTKAFGQAYDLARSGMQFVPDAQYIADHKAFTGVLNSGVLDANQASQVQKVINTSVGSRLPRGSGVMTGDAYKQASSDVSRAIDTWSRNPNTQPMANALSDYQTIFDSAARRNSNPEAVSLLDAADRGWAKYARVRNAGARVGGDPGTFTMKNLQRAVQQEGGGVASGPFQRGQALMQDYSTAIQPLGDTLSNSGTGERLLTNRLMLGSQGAVGAGGVATGAAGALMAHPGALAPFAAYAPGINRLVTRAIAPRSATLPAPVADLLDVAAMRLRQRAPFAGRLAVPAALAWELGQ
jgi:hypothetical protein